jgi:hypothetical protein
MGDMDFHGGRGKMKEQKGDHEDEGYGLSLRPWEDKGGHEVAIYEARTEAEEKLEAMRMRDMKMVKGCVKISERIE